MKKQSEGSDKTAGVVIFIYLIIHILLLSFLGLSTWIASDWCSFTKLIPIPPFPPFSYSALDKALSPEKFNTFQDVILASCAAGLGGAIFMIREFYLNYAYGRERFRQPVKYLRNKEIPRYVLLPFSSIVLGPIILGLLLSGSIIFGGFSNDSKIPNFTIVTVSFLMGFSYHDTLKMLREKSRELFKMKSKNGIKGS